jgi:hypothetical protein
MQTLAYTALVMIPGKKKLSALPVRCAKNAAIPMPINPENTCCNDCRRAKRNNANTAAVPTEA